MQKYIDKIFEQNKDLGKIEFLSENQVFYDLLKSLEQEIQYINSLQASFPAIHLYYNKKQFNESKNHAYSRFFNEQSINKQKELENYIVEIKKMKDYFSRKLTSENIISYNTAYINLLSQLQQLEQLNTKIAEKEIKNLENFKVILEEIMNNKYLEEKAELMKEKQKHVFTTCRTIENIIHKSTEFNIRASELRQKLLDRNLHVPQFLQKQYAYSKNSSIKEVNELGKMLENCTAKCDIIYNNVFELNKMVPCIFDLKKILEDRYEIIKNNGNIKNEITLKKLKELIDENARLIASINIENIQKEKIQEKVLMIKEKLQAIME